MVAKNKDGQELKLNFVSGKGAVRGSVECMCSIYESKSNYANPGMLDYDWLMHRINAGIMNVYTLVTEDGTTAATLAATKNQTFNEVTDISSLTVNPGFKGYRLGDIITAHTISECEKDGYSLLHGPIVMYHTVTSVMYENHGFAPVGFLFGDCDATKHHAELGIAAKKHSVGLYVRNSGKDRSVCIYIPKHIEQCAQEVYESLRVAPTFKHDEKDLEDRCILNYEQDENHRALYTYIWKCGDDLSSKIGRLEQDYAHALQTYYIYLSITDPGAVKGFETLRGLGYRFSGFKPLCGSDEFLIMSKVSNELVDYSELKMSAPLSSLFERIMAL